MIEYFRVINMSENKYYGNASPKICLTCVHGKKYNGDENIYCLKKGIVEKYSSCRKYKYDALKRIPSKPKKLPEHDFKEFEL